MQQNSFGLLCPLNLVTVHKLIDVLAHVAKLWISALQSNPQIFDLVITLNLLPAVGQLADIFVNMDCLSIPHYLWPLSMIRYEWELVLISVNMEWYNLWECHTTGKMMFVMLSLMFFYTSYICKMSYSACLAYNKRLL